MSVRAVCYVKELRVCPNGESIAKLEKLVLYALADYHQDKMGLDTYPSVESLASESLMDERSCRRALNALERKGVIERSRPVTQGRGVRTFYRFCVLDRLTAEKQERESTEKGGQNVPLFFDKRGAKGGQKGDRNGTAYKEERKRQQEQELSPQPPTQARGAEAGNLVPIDECRGASSDSTLGGQADAGLVRRMDAAAQLVMEGCGFVEKRLRRVIRQVMAQDYAAKDTEPEATAKAMSQSWRSYCTNGELLRVHYGPGKFFSLGIWRDDRLWGWDEAKIERRRAARVGCF